MAKWSEETWTQARPIYDTILAMPFIKELTNGSLPRDKFLFYLKQDTLYIDGYAQILAHIASRLTDKKHIESFIRFALDGIEVERYMHSQFVSEEDLKDVEKTPTCLLYTSFLSSKSLGPVEIEAAAILPCFWIYQKVGEEIVRNASLEGNPYRSWIETYGDENFAESNRLAIEICDQLATAATAEVREKMTQAFLMATRMEWMFWNSAYNLEQWKI